MNRDQKQAAAILGEPFTYKGITFKRFTMAAQLLLARVGNNFPHTLTLESAYEAAYVLSNSREDVSKGIEQGTFAEAVLDFAEGFNLREGNEMLALLLNQIEEDNSVVVAPVKPDAGDSKKK